jgi:hypothetical protein
MNLIWSCLAVGQQKSERRDGHQKRKHVRNFSLPLSLASPLGRSISSIKEQERNITLFWCVLAGDIFTITKLIRQNEEEKVLVPAGRKLFAAAPREREWQKN